MKKINKLIAIGASAGGLDAIIDFFKLIPSDTGHAYVVIQHLSPRYKSLMPEILSKYSQMPIHVAEDNMQLNPNCIYLNRSTKNLSVKGSKLLLPNKKTGDLNLPIDLFFDSLGREFKDRSIAIIFSGTGSDGSKGIKSIKENNGAVYVQSLDTAEFDSMPEKAMATGMVDFALSPSDMAKYVCSVSPRSNSSIKKGTELSPFDALLIELKKRKGIDFSRYKDSTLKRRLEKRVKQLRLKSVDHYLKEYKNDDHEINELYADFLVGVTEFFRNDEAYEALITHVFPSICKDGDLNMPIRVWVPGCSTGEEAYSIAMALDLFLEENNINRDFQIFASDINEESLTFARNGVYSLESVESIDKKYLGRYFENKEKKAKITQSIRDKITFAKNDLLEDPPFIKMDLVSCRNLLIYLDENTKNNALINFRSFLRSGGYLFLGDSESLGYSEKDFKTIDAKWKIFKSKVNKTQHHHFPSSHANQIQNMHKTSLPNLSPSRYAEVNFYKYISDQYSPALIFVDKECHIHFIKGDIGSKLHPKEGLFHQNLLKMVDSAFGLIIQNGIRKVEKTSKSVQAKGVSTNQKKNPNRFDLRISPAKLPHVHEKLFVLEFSDDHEDEVDNQEIESISQDFSISDRMEELEQELHFKNEELRHLMDELGTRNEEIQSSNEELMASNEELQSTNEELQSVIEELYTVNSELQQKNDKVEELYADLANLYSSQDIASIFLDNQLCIRFFTPSIRKSLDLKDSDIGRPLSHFMFFDQHVREQLLSQASICLEKAEQYEYQFEENDRVNIIRINPFTNNGRIEGVVITLIDVDELVKTQDELELSRNQYEKLFRNLNVGFCVNELVYNKKGKPVDLIQRKINPAFEKILNLSAEEVLNQTMEVFEFDKEVMMQFVNLAHDVEVSGKSQSLQFWFENFKKHLQIEIFSSGEKNNIGWVFYDMTEIVESEKAIEREKEKYKHLFQNMNCGFAMTEVIFNEKDLPIDLRYITVNSEFEKITGLKKSQVEGRSIKDSSDTPQEDQFWIEFAAKTARSKQPQTVTSYVTNFDKYLEVNVFPGEKKNELGFTFLDVTAEMVAEEKLKSANTRLNLANNIGKMAIWEWSVETDQVVNYNDHWENLYEIKPEKVSDQFNELIHPDDKDEAWAAISEHIANKTETYTQDFRIWSPSLEKYKWIRNAGKVVKWQEDGSAALISGISADITDIKASERELEGKTFELKWAQSLAKLGSWYLDIDSNDVKWSEEIYRMYGFDPELPPPPYTEHMKLFTNKSWKQLSVELNKTIEKGISYDLELEMSTDHASFGWMRAMGQPVKNKEGKIVGVRGIAQDITEQKEFESRILKERAFRELLTETSTCGIYIFDVRLNRNIYINKKGAELLGYTVDEIQKMDSQTFVSRFHVDDLDHVVEHINDLVSFKKEKEIKYRFKLSDGTYRHFYSTDTPFEIDKDGKLVSYIGSFIDITKQEETEKELVKAKEEAEQASKQKDLFLSNMSHEIRTPLNGVIGFSKLLKRDNLLPESKEMYLEQIESNSQQLMTIINDVLNLSKIDSGSFKLNKEKVNFHRVLRGIVDGHIVHLKDMEDKGNIKIVLKNRSPRKPLGIKIDEVRFSQVINNLITNAIKYSKKGTIEVGYKVKKHTIDIWVKDEGIGIKKDQLELIFQRFSQVHEKLSRQTGGIGLGLAISKAITTALGGTISVESTYRKGSKFTLTIPYEPVEPSDTDIVFDRKVKKVIVGDDSPSVQFYFKSLMEEYDIELLQAYDGSEVLDLLKDNDDVDLIFMDMRMPNMDGPTALLNLRKFNKDVKVVGQSAFAIEEQVEKFKSYGFDDYITKPIDEDKFKKLINH